ARCPPAEMPQAPIRSGSMPYLLDWLRRKRTAHLQSSSWAGNGASCVKRYSIEAPTKPIRANVVSINPPESLVPSRQPPPWIEITQGRLPAAAALDVPAAAAGLGR